MSVGWATTTLKNPWQDGVNLIWSTSSCEQCKGQVAAQRAGLRLYAVSAHHSFHCNICCWEFSGDLGPVWPEHGQSRDAGELLHLGTGLKKIVVSVIIGEGIWRTLTGKPKFDWCSEKASLRPEGWVGVSQTQGWQRTADRHAGKMAVVVHTRKWLECGVVRGTGRHQTTKGLGILVLESQLFSKSCRNPLKCFHQKMPWPNLCWEITVALLRRMVLRE